MLFDAKNSQSIPVFVTPQIQADSATAIVGEIVDLVGAHSCTLALTVGTPGAPVSPGEEEPAPAAAGTMTAVLEEGDSPTLTDAATVSAEHLIDGPSSAFSFDFETDGVVKTVGYRGTKRYLRLTLTPSLSNTVFFNVAGVAILGSLAKEPTA